MTRAEIHRGLRQAIDDAMEDAAFGTLGSAFSFHLMTSPTVIRVMRGKSWSEEWDTLRAIHTDLEKEAGHGEVFS